MPYLVKVRGEELYINDRLEYGPRSMAKVYCFRKQAYRLANTKGQVKRIELEVIEVEEGIWEAYKERKVYKRYEVGHPPD